MYSLLLISPIQKKTETAHAALEPSVAALHSQYTDQIKLQREK